MAALSSAKRPRPWAATVEVTVQLGLAGRSVCVAVPETMRVSDLRAQLALASPDFEHETWKNIGRKPGEKPWEMQTFWRCLSWDCVGMWVFSEFLMEQAFDCQEWGDFVNA